MTDQADYAAWMPAILALLENGKHEHAEQLARHIGMTVEEILTRHKKPLDSLSERG